MYKVWRTSFKEQNFNTYKKTLRNIKGNIEVLDDNGIIVEKV